MFGGVAPIATAAWFSTRPGVKYVCMDPSSVSLPCIPKNHRIDESRTNRKPFENSVPSCSKNPLKPFIISSLNDSTSNRFVIIASKTPNITIVISIGSSVESIRLNSLSTPFDNKTIR